MAAGQGTRMRSKLRKVLHPVCGRPMVHWPVVAARDAGAAAVVVVGGADRALDGRLPDGVILAVQPAPDGTGGAVRAALPHLVAGLPVVVLSGDVPLVSAQVIGALVEAHLTGGASATMVTTRLADPSGYGRVVRDTTGGVLRVVETKSPGDASPEELAIDEVNTGIFCFEPEALRRALADLRADNAQGEYYLPDTLPALEAEGAPVAAHEVERVVAVGVVRAGPEHEDLVAHGPSVARERLEILPLGVEEHGRALPQVAVRQDEAGPLARA